MCRGLVVLHRWFHLILATILWGSRTYYPHQTDENSESERRGALPRVIEWQVAETSWDADCPAYKEVVCFPPSGRYHPWQTSGWLTFKKATLVLPEHLGVSN